MAAMETTGITLPRLPSRPPIWLLAACATLLLFATGCDKGDGDEDQGAGLFGKQAEFYKMVHELMEPGSSKVADRWLGKRIRVHGYVEAGSISEQIVDSEIRRRFVVENQGKTIEVEHDGPKPDTFRDMAEVVITGKIVERSGKHVLVAKEIMAKCPSKYEGGVPAGSRGKNNF